MGEAMMDIVASDHLRCAACGAFLHCEGCAEIHKDTCVPVPPPDRLSLLDEIALRFAVAYMACPGEHYSMVAAQRGYEFADAFLADRERQREVKK